MVTLYYMRRYVDFLQQVLSEASGEFELSAEVGRWLNETATALAEIRPRLGAGPVSGAVRLQSLERLGRAASEYRERAYASGSLGNPESLELSRAQDLLTDALAAIDHCIATNRREDGLYHAYNLLSLADGEAGVDTLYPMLEGQVAALSAGAIEARDVIDVIEALFASDVYRPDQNSFMLYPDRELPGFLDKNRIPRETFEAIPLLTTLLAQGDRRIAVQDADGNYRFSSEFANVGDLDEILETLAEDCDSSLAPQIEEARPQLRALFEQVFNHQAFTGRSGGMFGFEGLGCIYWHMVSKLLLAVQENFFAALGSNSDLQSVQQLGELYYRVREGIGFNKTPQQYGAFPTDPYSHTPGHSGARQPGMTGQVKEEVLTRFGELGIRVDSGSVSFAPALLRAREFVEQPRGFRYLDVHDHWQDLELAAGSLAFTWCQVPLVYSLNDDSDASITLTFADGSRETLPGLTLPIEYSKRLFGRDGHIRRLDLQFERARLFGE